MQENEDNDWNDSSGQAMRESLSFEDPVESRAVMRMGSMEMEQGLASAGDHEAMKHFWARIKRRDIVNRRWSAALLLTGSICGFCGFFLATCVGIIGDLRGNDKRRACYIDERCASDRSYHAETVSEMVSVPGEPAAKLFYSFTVIASICLIVSRYPWELRNVYVENEFGCCSLASIRALLPPLGMMIVAQVPVVPRAERDVAAKRIACNIHTCGAVMFVAGYNVMEVMCLRKLWPRLNFYEKHLRALFVAGSSVCMVGFVLAGAIYGSSEALGICCMDQYVDSVRGIEHIYGNVSNNTLDMEIIHKLYGNKMLSDSAKELGLFIKKTEFWAEEFAGVFIILSHLTIWYYCEGRKLQVPAMIES